MFAKIFLSRSGVKQMTSEAKSKELAQLARPNKTSLTIFTTLVNEILYLIYRAMSIMGR